MSTFFYRLREAMERQMIQVLYNLPKNLFWLLSSFPAMPIGRGKYEVFLPVWSPAGNCFCALPGWGWPGLSCPFKHLFFSLDCFAQSVGKAVYDSTQEARHLPLAVLFIHSSQGWGRALFLPWVLCGNIQRMWKYYPWGFLDQCPWEWVGTGHYSLAQLIQSDC